MSSVPRDPGHYFPSVHAGQRKRDRKIDWELISEAIQKGEIEDHPKNPNCKLIRYNPANDFINIGVVVEPESGKIVTFKRDFHGNDDPEELEMGPYRHTGE